MGIFGGKDYGKKLVRGEYNTQPYGPLEDLYKEGLANGTDFYTAKSMFCSIRFLDDIITSPARLCFYLDRLSCMWSSGTPGSLFLYENEIRTIFLSGVNGDQCVLGTMYDAFFRVSLFLRCKSHTSAHS